MTQSSDSSTRALATLVTALGITIGATPATLHAQSPANAPSREAVQSKHKPEAVQDKQKAAEAVQIKVGAKEAVQIKSETKEAVQIKVQAKEAVQNKAATPEKAAGQWKAPAPAKPL